MFQVLVATMRLEGDCWFSGQAVFVQATWVKRVPYLFFSFLFVPVRGLLSSGIGCAEDSQQHAYMYIRRTYNGELKSHMYLYVESLDSFPASSPARVSLHPDFGFLWGEI